MTEALDTIKEALLAELAEIGDPVERYRKARERRLQLKEADLALMDAQRVVVIELKDGRSWREVGELLDITGARAEQIAKGR